jgi:hypothetical protein
MKKLLQFLILFILISLIWYSIFSFIIWDISMSNWCNLTRFIFGIGEILILFICLMGPNSK